MTLPCCSLLFLNLFHAYICILCSKTQGISLSLCLLLCSTIYNLHLYDNVSSSSSRRSFIKSRRQRAEGFNMIWILNLKITINIYMRPEKVEMNVRILWHKSQTFNRFLRFFVVLKYYYLICLVSSCDIYKALKITHTKNFCWDRHLILLVLSAHCCATRSNQ